jgi:hypothetical protein
MYPLTSYCLISKSRKMKTLNFKSFLLSAILSFICITQVTAQDDVAPGGWSNSTACDPQATSWNLGGNIILPPPVWNPNSTCANCPMPLTDAGTCNDFPFILKANNKQSVYIMPNGNVGIGPNNYPSSALDIRGSYSSYRIFGDPMGNIVSTSGINTTFNPLSNFNINVGSVATNTNLFSIEGQSGYVSIGGLYPASAKLDVQDPNYSEVRAYTDSQNDASMWTVNTVSSYGMTTDGAGIGHISWNEPSPLQLMNFRWNANTAKPSIWVGYQKPVAPHDDFAFAVSGKLVAQSIYVTNVNNWADYVFASDYKLPKLYDVEAFYKENKHLPEIPTAREVEEKGIDVAEMNTLLLKKVEELTMYVVEQQKQMDALKEEVRSKK